MGTNPATGEAYLYGHGNLYFGDQDMTDPESTWITFQKKEGSDRKKLYIKGNIEMGADTTGLQNVEEFKNLENKSSLDRKSMMIINTDNEVNEETLSKISKIDGIYEAQFVKLNISFIIPLFSPFKPAIINNSGFTGRKYITLCPNASWQYSLYP